MRLKDKLCRKAVELENEIEFRKEIKKSFKVQKDLLKRIYSTLKELKEESLHSLLHARELVKYVDSNA